MVSCHIDHDRGPIYIRCAEPEEIIELVSSISLANGFDAAYNTIADCRGPATEYSPSQLEEILRAVTNSRASAIIARCGIVVDDRLRLVTATTFSVFALASKSSSVNAKVFRTVEEAEEWLNVSKRG
jgi:hypothetical protein